MMHLTSAILAGLGAVFGLAGLLCYWASGRAIDGTATGEWAGDVTRGGGGCALLFVALGLGACAVSCLVAGGIVFLIGH
jgi:hypothetical protein